MHQAETAAFLNQKGGVGKTTSVVNVGAGLSILGKKVLIIDLDPQGHLTEFLGISSDEISYTIYDVLKGRIHPREAIITKPLRARIYMGDSEAQLSISVIPASHDLAEADVAFANTFEREHLLKRAIARVNGDYDYILFDCPPSLGFVTTNALAASKKVFVPVQTEYLALRSLDKLMEKIESVMEELNPELTIGGIIAMGLALGRPAGEVRELVQSASARIFPPPLPVWTALRGLFRARFDAAPLREVIEAVVGTVIELSSDIAMRK